MSRRRQRVLLITASVLLALVITEIGLRVASRWLFIDVVIRPDALIGWTLIPNYAGWSNDENMVWVTHNSAGFRDRERAVAALPDTVRVAVIGDSFIHGYFLPLDDTFPAQLEAQMSACAAARGKHPEVLSFGAFGYNTTQELLIYQHHASRYRPDIVVVAMFTANDIFDNHPQLSTENAPRYLFDHGELVLDTSFRDRLPPPPAWPWRRRTFEFLTTQVQTLRLAKMAVDGLRDWRSPIAGVETRAPFGLTDNSIYQPPVAPAMTEAWQLTEAVLLKFAADVRAAGSEFWIATLFNAEQVDPNLNHRRELERELRVDSLFYPDRRIAHFAETHGIPVISLAEPLAARTAAESIYLNGGNSTRAPEGTGHWNALGARLSAELAANRLCATSGTLAAGVTATETPGDRPR